MIRKKSNSLIALIVCFMMFSGTAAAQVENDAGAPEGIIIGARYGASYFITEMYRDLSGSVSDFDNSAGTSAGLEISRFFTPVLEVGVGMSWSVLQGQAASPDFSAIGIDPFLDETLTEPVEYNNRLNGPGIFARYHFNLMPDNPDVLTLFLKAGAGVLINESELFYSNRTGDEIIFGKGTKGDKSSMLANGVYSIGSGLSYALTETVFLKLAADLNMVGYDLLDVVHNYDAAGNRQNVLGMFTDITAGIAIKLSGGGNKSSAGRGKSKSGGHLPFAP